MGKKKSAHPADQPVPESLTFEEALSRLEATVLKLEDGQLGLSESLAHYERGVRYLQACYHQLDQAEQKIELLAGLDAEGNPLTEAFDEGQLSLEQKQAARSRRRSGTAPRSGPGASDPPMDDLSSLF